MIEKVKLLEVLDKNPYISFKGLAEYFGITKRQVQSLMENYKIKRDRKSQHKFNTGKRGNIKEISPVCLEIINGSLLGDGHMSKYEIIDSKIARNSKMCIKHSIKQEDYVLYKKFLFENNGYKVYTRYRQSKSCIEGRKVVSNTIEIITESNENFNAIRKLWYPENVKIIPTNLVLTPLTLAIWFMDDGSKHSSGYYLHTQGFTLDDIFLLKLKLKENLGILSSIHKSRQLYNLYIPANSSVLFTKTVLPYMTDSMLYKIHGSH